MYDKDGFLKETVAIEKWNTDSVEEFLNTHLETGNDYLSSNLIWFFFLDATLILYKYKINFLIYLFFFFIYKMIILNVENENFFTIKKKTVQ